MRTFAFFGLHPLRNLYTLHKLRHVGIDLGLRVVLLSCKLLFIPLVDDDGDLLRQGFPQSSELTKVRTQNLKLPQCVVVQCNRRRRTTISPSFE
jgi:hypothetical protein